jgi:hypothetical protein
LHEHVGDGAADVRAQRVFHLHGLDDEYRLADFDDIADRRQQRDDGAGHRALDCSPACGVGARRDRLRNGEAPGVAARTDPRRCSERSDAEVDDVIVEIDPADTVAYRQSGLRH